MEKVSRRSEASRHPIRNEREKLCRPITIDNYVTRNFSTKVEDLP